MTARLTARSLLPLSALGLVATAAFAAPPEAAAGEPSLWLWATLLFVFCVAIGVVAVIAGVGGGILYVPLVSALFPFHLDYVRGAGLMIALAGALSAAPQLLHTRLASIRLAVPAALMVAIGAIVGAKVGLAIPKSVVELLLGIVIFGVVVLLWQLGSSREDGGEHPYGVIAKRFGMAGEYREGSTGETIAWTAWRARRGLPIAVGIGLLGGLFGVGGGWANVPNFNLVMGVPLKVATATSVLLFSLGSASAAWVYLNDMSVLPFMAVPSILGLMIGSRIGAGMLDKTKPAVVRKVVLTMLLLAGIRAAIAGVTGLLGGAHG